MALLCKVLYTIRTHMLKTPQQRKELCKECSIAKVADLVGDSCIILIIRDLLTGPRRFKDLSSSLSGISTRTLSNKLKFLEERNLITRTTYAERPPRVEYALTFEGRELDKLLKEMNYYGEKYL